MKSMTPAELHKLLTEAVIGAHQELAKASGHENPHVRRAYELLTSAMDRVISAAHLAYPDRPDIVSALESSGEHAACPCDCHTDRQGRREWPLLTDSLGEITACSRCRDDHRRLMPPQQDTAA